MFGAKLLCESIIFNLNIEKGSFNIMFIFW